MSKVNLYKIDNFVDFTNDLNENYEKFVDESVLIPSSEDNWVYDMNLYYKTDDEKNNLSWQWIFEQFKGNKFNDKFNHKPKAILLIKLCKKNEDHDSTFFREIFAVSFGQAYHTIDKYANKEWVFEIIKRLKYTQLRTMAITMPNSRNNRRINTYYGNATLDWGSGEAITNLKAKINAESIDLPFDETIQMGNSINVKIKENKLEFIAKLIDFTYDILNFNVQYKNLPYFKKITNQKKVKNLEENLNHKFNELLIDSSLDYDFDISEYNVMSSNISFLNEEVYYKYYGENGNSVSENLEQLNVTNLLNFIKKVQKDFPDENINLFNVHILFKTKENENSNWGIKKFIFFVDNDSNALLIDGAWNKFDNNYINFLNDSIDKITVESDNKYDLNSDEYLRFIKNENNSNCFTEEIFNQFMNKCYHYELYDRKNEMWEKYKVEIMDLYDPVNKIFFAVKIGAESSKLSYVFDQCINGLIYLEQEEPKKYADIKKVCIWIIYDKEGTPFATDISYKENGQRKVNLKNLNLLIVKTRLDEWRKFITSKGFEPIVRVNFKPKSKIKAFDSPKN